MLEREGDDRRWDVWMASLFWWHEFEQAPGVGEGQGGLACCSPWSHQELDTTEWTELSWTTGNLITKDISLISLQYCLEANKILSIEFSPKLDNLLSQEMVPCILVSISNFTLRFTKPRNGPLYFSFYLKFYLFLVPLYPPKWNQFSKIHKLPNIYNTVLQYLKDQYYKSVLFLPFYTRAKKYSNKCWQGYE